MDIRRGRIDLDGSVVLDEGGRFGNSKNGYGIERGR